MCTCLLHFTDRTVKLYNLAQKGSIRFTKLLIPCNSVHAYSPKQSPIVFLQLLYKFSLLALNIKSENYPPFWHVIFSQPGIATPISVKRIDPSCLSDRSRMHYPLTTHIIKHFDQNNCRSLIEATKPQ